ncbi:alkaline phosphatase family protein [Candidatus Bathyarchaeota archaeon]|nr:alkaline phosphatase family protein [Candidatus Bathyarchaeota archaeon]
MKTKLLICLDGCSWDYIRASRMPNLASLVKKGTSIECKAIVPTVTNVNNASILTGEFPAIHGISGNYYFDRSTGLETYMDASVFLRCETFLAKASKRKLRTALLTVKDKLRRLLGKDVTNSFSVEAPSSWAIEKIGKPPSIYSSEASLWLLDATMELIVEDPFDLVYVSTTDYVPHIYGPFSERAREYMERIDERVGLLLERGIAFGITSDHGMTEKRIKVDLEKALLERNIKAKVLPIIKDEYVTHHQNLGGSVYLYLEEPREALKAKEVIANIEGMEAVLTAWEAREMFGLPLDRIGDLFALGDERTVFGPVSRGLIEDVRLRSHGSLHELSVPLILSWKTNRMGEKLNSNKEAFRLLLYG